MKSYLEIDGRRIAPGSPAYIIAEMSANHNQDLDYAVRTLKAAKESGADAVKLQTYTPETITIKADTEYFRVKGGTLWDGSTLYDLYASAFMPWEWQPKLKTIANEMGLDLFSSPFDQTAVDFLEQMQVPAYKIASFEIIDIPLLKAVAHTGKPIIISTGMATLEEIKEAIKTVCESGADQVALLRCTSAYPAPPEEMNLRSIPQMASLFEIPIGLSDHTLDIPVPVAAVALGATIIEKHFTLTRSIPGPDSAFSLEPSEFKAMVSAIRTVEQALGSPGYGASPSEAKSHVFRKSLFIVKDVKAGELFTSENVRPIRPGYGLHTRHFEEILGCCATMNLTRGTPLTWDMVCKDRVTTHRV